LVERVAKRELDAAYFFALTEADVPEAGLIGMEELAIYVGPGHRFAGRTNVTLAELAGEPSAQLTRRDPLAALISRAFAACGVTDRAIGIETDDFGLIVSFVLRNQGYACLFASTADEPGSATGLVRVPLRPPLPPLQVRLLSRRSAEHDPVLSAFMDAVAERWRGS
jgi:DNA-binding transcriptional LysR family regulator